MHCTRYDASAVRLRRLAQCCGWMVEPGRTRVPRLNGTPSSLKSKYGRGKQMQVEYLFRHNSTLGSDHLLPNTSLLY
jgi:hypothetical protein